MDRPVVAITIGDPAGVGPEIVVKAMANGQVTQACRPWIVGDLPVLERAAKIAGVALQFRACSTRAEHQEPGAVCVLDTQAGGEKAAFGRVSAEGGQAAYAAIQRAVELCQRGDAVALATAPINKEALRKAGVPYLDHTEALTGLTGARSALTLFATGTLRVFFLTRHLPFREIAAHITEANIVAYAQDCERQMRRLGFPQPKLAIAALNPHGGEHGLFGDEEMREIVPAVETLRGQGFDVHGPIPADSVFHLAHQGAYDAVISLYHDQGHIATKTLDFYRTVSLTLGLPFLRSSVDHGTAFDIAGTGQANEISMVEAIIAGATYGPKWRRGAET
jgi:4-phospho-D-threonate 3-dehydrogenase / 4-phospho-D-erythronate 3-dehydrogenase